jgi:NADH dehydrogenase
VQSASETTAYPAQRVLIIGGGFAGATLTRALERRVPHAYITLLSQENYITYSPLLAEVVGASILPSHVVAPLRQMVRHARVRTVQVSRIDLVAKQVHYQGEDCGLFEYDHLVLAYGNQANLTLTPGMARHALPLKTVGDALFLRNRIIARLERAELADDDALRAWLTTFVVIGGGFSGVEVAGEISDFLHASRAYYGCLRHKPRVVLIHSGKHLLPELPETLGRYSESALLKRGVEIYLNMRTQVVDERGVLLNNGEQILAGSVICTIGTRANTLTDGLPVETLRGRIVTQADMSVPGYPGVWALGDCAAVPNAHDSAISSPTAQFALRQAHQLAANLALSLQQRATRSFDFKPKGVMSAIGHNRAVASVFGVNMVGFPAWLLWRGFYLLNVPTLARKARLFLEWNWAMFFPPDTSHLRFTRTERQDVEATQSVDE